MAWQIYSSQKWACLDVLIGFFQKVGGAASFLLYFASSAVMGGGVSRREPEVHVVVVQSQENGKMDAKVLRQTFTSLGRGTGRGECKGDLHLPE